MKNKYLFVITAIVVLFVGGYLVVELGRKEPSLKTPDDVALVKLKMLEKIDAVSEKTFDIEIAANLKKQEVKQMPELVLALPDQTWFAQKTMQLIGYYLGFDKDATVENLGEQIVWREGVKTLTINSKIGMVNLTTAFNLGQIRLPEVVPAQDLSKNALEEFLTKSKLKSDFFDLSNLSFKYLDLDANHQVVPVSSQGILLRIDIPCTISGVRIILPVENYAILDGDGKIWLLSLLIPNIKQTDAKILPISWTEAKRQLDKGIGIPIKLNQTGESQFVIEEISLAYYLNQKDFYMLGKRRRLTPIYVFAGPSGQMAILAE